MLGENYEFCLLFLIALLLTLFTEEKLNFCPNSSKGLHYYVCSVTEAKIAGHQTSGRQTNWATWATHFVKWTTEVETTGQQLYMEV